MAKEKVKEKIVPVERKTKKAGTFFATLMAIISLITGIYLLMQNYGLYQKEIPKMALIVVLILTGLTSLMQIGKIMTLQRLERIKQRYI